MNPVRTIEGLSTLRGADRRLLAVFPHPDDAVLTLSDDEIAKKEACLRVHDALVTIVPDGPPDLLRRPPEERYDFFGEEAEVTDLFEGLVRAGSRSHGPS